MTLPGVTPDTRLRLDRLKAHPDESDDQLINRLIDSYEDDTTLTREEVEEIRAALRDLKEGRFFTRDQTKERSPESQEMPPSSAGDPQAVKDMEALFSGTAEKVHDPELAEPDPDEIHEIEDSDKRGRSCTPHLDTL